MAPCNLGWHDLIADFNRDAGKLANARLVAVRGLNYTAREAQTECPKAHAGRAHHFDIAPILPPPLLLGRSGHRRMCAIAHGSLPSPVRGGRRRHFASICGLCLARCIRSCVEKYRVRDTARRLPPMPPLPFLSLSLRIRNPAAAGCRQDAPLHGRAASVCARAFRDPRRRTARWRRDGSRIDLVWAGAHQPSLFCARLQMRGIGRNRETRDEACAARRRAGAMARRGRLADYP